MSQPLPRLRMNLEFMPSPVEDRPGLLIRDTFGYSDAVLIVPPPLVPCLEYFDGERTELDLREVLVRITGQFDVSPIQEQLAGTLGAAGFLHDEIYENLRDAKQKEFRESALREPNHAGTGYPDEPLELQATLTEYMKGGLDPDDENLIAVAAPHVSPFGGWQTYRAAYSSLSAAHQDRVFVVLGTSHYGEPDRFGLTRKPFVTPFGAARPELGLINELADEPAVLMEDFCHSVEHSIEFQIVFLQHLYGPDIRILPVLCGSFARSISGGGMPDDNEDVERFLGHLGEIGAREGKRLMWILGVDMAHMGARYGDPFIAEAGRDAMEEVARRDYQRIERMNAGDSTGFWELVQQNEDDLKWCGSAPIYTFLKAMPGAKGSLRGYEQWNIDEQSVVSFGAVSFRR
ncbi:MAG: AmmeMemoRadiSam system protein B [Bryobacteraceae bacterium]|nr:AmmeMemoRadiSam system protein B [Bryobacteraceae bacterium]